MAHNYIATMGAQNPFPALIPYTLFHSQKTRTLSPSITGAKSSARAQSEHPLFHSNVFSGSLHWLELQCSLLPLEPMCLRLAPLQIELVVPLYCFLGATLAYLCELWRNPIFSPKQAGLAWARVPGTIPCFSPHCHSGGELMFRARRPLAQAKRSCLSENTREPHCSTARALALAEGACLSERLLSLERGLPTRARTGRGHDQVLFSPLFLVDDGLWAGFDEFSMIFHMEHDWMDVIPRRFRGGASWSGRNSMTLLVGAHGGASLFRT
ncbi:hypothetical protein DEO72_LG5g1952 [Vigna unguiculata]|uniref:Uncharacterized protein n=1 Tax=Vigna unguiculata TaxID=3917 RepID=A0A4D6M105_VIGUN|nr:hypothetical protein DEO72_LG5g1952 [Vigna unguiculata]